MRSASHSNDLLERTKYAATVIVKSLMEPEGEEERRMRRKKIDNHRLTIRLGADGRENDHANNKLASPDHGFLERAKRNAKLTTLVLAIYADRLLVVVVFIAAVVVVVVVVVVSL